MSNYIYYGYLVGCAIALIGMVRTSVAHTKIATSLLLFLFAFYLLKNYFITYFIVGMIFASIMVFFASLSDAIKSKNKFLNDLKDISIIALMAGISILFWMQIICINLYVDPRKIEL